MVNFGIFGNFYGGVFKIIKRKFLRFWTKSKNLVPCRICRCWYAFKFLIFCRICRCSYVFKVVIFNIFWYKKHVQVLRELVPKLTKTWQLGWFQNFWTFWKFSKMSRNCAALEILSHNFWEAPRITQKSHFWVWWFNQKWIQVSDQNHDPNRNLVRYIFKTWRHGIYGCIYNVILLCVSIVYFHEFSHLTFIHSVLIIIVSMSLTNSLFNSKAQQHSPKVAAPRSKKAIATLCLAISSKHRFKSLPRASSFKPSLHNLHHPTRDSVDKDYVAAPTIKSWLPRSP